MDKYKYSDDVSSPSRNPYPITPNDSVALTVIPKALYVGNGGTITLKGELSTANTVFLNVASGSILPVRALYVYATGTTANSIVALV